MRGAKPGQPERAQQQVASAAQYHKHETFEQSSQKSEMKLDSISVRVAAEIACQTQVFICSILLPRSVVIVTFVLTQPAAWAATRIPNQADQARDDHERPTSERATLDSRLWRRLESEVGSRV